MSPPSPASLIVMHLFSKKLQVKLFLSHRHLMSYCTTILFSCSYVARFHAYSHASLSHVVSGVLIEMQRFFRQEGIFHNCAISVQISLKTCIARRRLRTTRSTSSEHALLPRRRLAAKIHMYQGDKVLHPGRLSVCLSHA